MKGGISNQSSEAILTWENVAAFASLILASPLFRLPLFSTHKSLHNMVGVTVLETVQSLSRDIAGDDERREENADVIRSY